MSEKRVEQIRKAEERIQQSKNRLDKVKAMHKAAKQKEDTRRKIIMGGLLIDAAQKDPRWSSIFDELMTRISRDQDQKAFVGWTLNGEAQS
ncbi:MAG: mobilization protein [Caulobacter sp. 12-67-6]|nr:MAG: mobilization protein [Caulobacter sp. 12-67-6]